MKNTTTPLLLATLICGIHFCKASTINASTFGWNSADATTAFQSALTSNYDTVIIDKQATDWLVKPNTIFDISNKVIIFEKNVVLKALYGEYNNSNDCLLSLVRCKFITIVGYGAEFKMNRAEYAVLPDSAIGGWRMGLGISNCKNVSVYGLKISDSGGDGVFISGDTWYANAQNPDLFSENIIVKDVWSNNNYRQGISVVSAQNLLVQNCWFTNTNGTLPEAGVDIEPDNSQHRIKNVVFDKCRFTNNSGSGISVAMFFQDNSATPIDVVFKNCYSGQNHATTNVYAATEILVSAKPNNAVLGNVKFEKCMVENSQWTAVSMHTTENCFKTVFDNCVFKDVSKNTSSIYNTPIFIEVTDYVNNVPRFGGVSFNNCLIDYTSSLKYVGSYGNIATSAGMGSVFFNNVTVVNPNTTLGYDVTSGGGTPLNCTFNFNTIAAVSPVVLSFNADDDIIECTNKNSVINFSTTPLSNYPLPITYTVSGNGEHGYDYYLMNGFDIIPMAATANTDTMQVIINNETEPIKTATLILNASAYYTASNTTETVTISDCATTTTINELTNTNYFNAIPNPANNLITVSYVANNTSRVYISMYDSYGQKIMHNATTKQHEGTIATTINLETLASGAYYLQLILPKKVVTKKIIVQH